MPLVDQDQTFFKGVFPTKYRCVFYLALNLYNTYLARKSSLYALILLGCGSLIVEINEVLK